MLCLPPKHEFQKENKKGALKSNFQNAIVYGIFSLCRYHIAFCTDLSIVFQDFRLPSNYQKVIPDEMCNFYK